MFPDLPFSLAASARRITSARCVLAPRSSGVLSPSRYRLWRQGSPHCFTEKTLLNEDWQRAAVSTNCPLRASCLAGLELACPGLGGDSRCDPTAWRTQPLSSLPPSASMPWWGAGLLAYEDWLRRVLAKSPGNAPSVSSTASYGKRLGRIVPRLPEPARVASHVRVGGDSPRGIPGAGGHATGGEGWPSAHRWASPPRLPTGRRPKHLRE